MKRAIAAGVAIAALVGTFALGWATHSGGGTPAASANPSAQLAAAITGSNGPAPNAAAAKQRYESFVSDVAAKAGISSATLDSAIRSVIVSRIETAATAGHIKPAVAAKIEQAIKDGDFSQLIAQRVQALRARGVARPGLHILARLHRWLLH